MAKRSTKFQRVSPKLGGNTKDEPGTVKIQVVLVGAGDNGRRPVKGNICRSVTVKDAKVSDVFQAIEAAIIE